MTDIADGFGDFDANDAWMDVLVFENVDWEKVVKLQELFDQISIIPDPLERKNAAKLLIQELNGEGHGTFLAT